MYPKITSQNRRSLYQRSVYLIGFAVYVAFWWHEIVKLNYQSYFDSYQGWVIIIPSLILIAQTLLNKKWLWILVGIQVVVLSFFMLYILFFFVTIQIEKDYVPVRWGYDQIMMTIGIVAIVAVANILIWSVKPVKT